jgi:hypothetical protein
MEKCPYCGAEGTFVLVTPGAGRPSALIDLLLPFGVGIVSLLAVVTLLLRTYRQRKRARAEAPKHWLPCPEKK